MTALSLPRRGPGRVASEPSAILAASVALVVAGNLASVNRGPDAAAPLAGVPGAADPGGPVAPQPVQGPVSPPSAPFADTPASLAQIDGSIARWSANSRGQRAGLHLGRATLAPAVRGPGTDQRRRHRLRPRRGGRQPLARDRAAPARRAGAPRPDPARDPRLLGGRWPRHPPWTEPPRTSRPSSRSSATPASSSATSTARPRSTTRIQALAPGPAVTARQARVAFLRGDPARAVALAESAHAGGRRRRPGRPGPQLVRVPRRHALDVRAACPRMRPIWFDRAVADWPESFLALAGRARAAAALGDPEAAIAGYQRRHRRRPAAGCPDGARRPARHARRHAPRQSSSTRRSRRSPSSRAKAGSSTTASSCCST